MVVVVGRRAELVQVKWCRLGLRAPARKTVPAPKFIAANPSVERFSGNLTQVRKEKCKN